jgi:stage II sporulation protein D
VKRARKRARRALRGLVRTLRRSRRARGLLTVGAFGVVLGLVACVTEEVAPRSVDPLPGEPTIRVLLVEGAKQAKLGVDGPCQVVPSPGEPLLLEKLPAATLLPGDGTGIQFGERRFTGALECRFSPLGGGVIRLDDKPYEGELVVRADHGVVRAINHIPLEAYTAGVLGGEMPLSWPDAALEAQAVAVRTYAVWQYLHRRSQDFDVARDTRSQVYLGAAGERARTLVRATEGQVLTYESAVVEAYFHSTCAGETADGTWVFGGEPIPPLMGVSCGMCESSKHAHWTREFGAAELAKLLAPFGVKAPIVRVEALQWPRGGYVREVHVVHAAGETVIEAAKLRRALELKSTAFEVAAGSQGLSVVFTGRGWGHGVGLCQWGAKGCAEAGLDADDILKKYYPGAKLTRIYGR